MRGLLSCDGAIDPIRTGDLLITSELLYLLSHNSNTFIIPHFREIVKGKCGKILCQRAK